MNNFSINLKNKIVIVTGGGSGIGESISKLFSDVGAHVCILDINLEKAKTVAVEITEKGGSASSHFADVTDQGSMLKITKSIFEKWESIDIMINNAGISHIGKLDTTPESEFEKVFSVNVKGVYNGMFAVISYMKQQKSGVILNMGSVASSLGLPDRFAYSMSKGAVENMTYTVARDYLDYNIRCNSIAPGRVHTPFVDSFIAKHYPGKEKETFDALSKTQPIGRMGKPDEIAQLALYLCSDYASFITGSNFPIDGGFVKLNT